MGTSKEKIHKMFEELGKNNTLDKKARTRAFIEILEKSGDFDKDIIQSMIDELEGKSNKRIYAPNNTGVVGTTYGNANGSGTQINYSDNSKSTVVDNREGIMQRSNIGNSSNKPFSKCPYCGEGLNLPKTPKFCPHCGEQMTV